MDGSSVEGGPKGGGRAAPVYTGGGDRGETSLLGGQRVSKHACRVEAYGTIDELTSGVGVALAWCKTDAGRTWPEAAGKLERIQEDLMKAAAAVAAQDVHARLNLSRLRADAVKTLESEIDEMTGVMGELRSFVLPGGTPLSAQLHVCRTVCRRAERRLVELAAAEQVPSEVGPYLNRLSDWFFTAARYTDFRSGLPDRKWTSGRNESGQGGDGIP